MALLTGAGWCLIDCCGCTGTHLEFVNQKSVADPSPGLSRLRPFRFSPTKNLELHIILIIPIDSIITSLFLEETSYCNTLQSSLFIRYPYLEYCIVAAISHTAK